MYISHKNNILQQVRETEWNCRRKTKGISKSEYWTWLASVTSGDPPVVDYSGETGYTIVECTDEDVQARLRQLDDYRAEGVYNITWSDSKVSAVTGQDMAGEDITIQTHFSGDDTTKDARILADKWANVRRQRDRLLTESDWVIVKAKEEHINTSIDKKWTDYRTALRDITKQSDPDSITWPTKP